jgi:acetyl-CoA carboxylase carboxyltransferase component
MSYDYTVFAGTQGLQNHRKTDRMIDIATEGRMPLVLFAEGGGGRPGDTDGIPDAGGIGTFAHFATLSALVPPPVSLRHARHHGGSRDREERTGPAQQPHVLDRRQP